MVRSSSRRTRPLAIVALATRATGAPSRPASTGRASSWSRSGMPCSSLSAARACELISAMCTPCGQTWVQMPQLEQ